MSDQILLIAALNIISILIIVVVHLFEKRKSKPFDLNNYPVSIIAVTVASVIYMLVIGPIANSIVNLFKMIL